MSAWFFSRAVALAMAISCGQAAAACVFMPGPLGLAPLETVVSRAMGASAAVFTGKVTAIEYATARNEAGANLENQVVRLAADSWWKGVGTREVTLYTFNYRDADGMTSTEAHEYPYEVGKTYLVYADTFRDGLHAGVCTRTKAIDVAADDIAMLDALKSGPR